MAENLPIAEQLKAVPAKPGVYQYRDQSGQLLYVGKAKVLKNRVSSYFHEHGGHSPQIRAMVDRIARIDYIVTNSDLEALILEANLIKSLRPKYNIRLRDDKKYPWLVLTDEPFPRLEIRREPYKKGKAKSFGPFASPGALYQTLQLIRKIFPLRQRRRPLFKDRPCMNYFIGNCLGPCQGLVDKAEYDEVVRQLELFLKGQADDLKERIEADMGTASEAMDFEKAALLRDRLQAVNKILQRQRVMYQDVTIDQDVFGMAATELTGYIALLKVRRGRLIQTSFFDVAIETASSPEEAYRAFLFQYYEDNIDPTDLPTELILQFDLEDAEFLAQWVGSHRGRKITVTVPKRGGTKQDILDMAVKNAEESRERARIEQDSRMKNDSAEALLHLQERLGLPTVPQRIECYDISHVSGTDTVASMVVFTDGAPDKKEYRRFQIRSTEHGKPDDFKSMAEVIRRRFNKERHGDWPEPDLVIIDGGKGQLHAAEAALIELGIPEQPIISLAKKFEEVFRPGESRPVIFERDSAALYLLQRIRDEAHRFAITYHRRLRGKRQTASYLDDVPGIGEARKKRLLERFPSVESIRQASLEEIAAATGTRGKTAENLYEALRTSVAPQPQGV